MSSVIATKIQEKTDGLSAFHSGNYTLVGPKGPIAPIDWDKRIFPGCEIRVEIGSWSGYSPQIPTTPQQTFCSSVHGSSLTKGDGSLTTTTPRVNSPPNFGEESKDKLLLGKEGSYQPQLDMQFLDSKVRGHSSGGPISSVDSITTRSAPHSQSQEEVGFMLLINEDNSKEEHMGSLDVGSDINDRVSLLQQPPRKNTKFQSYVEDASEVEDCFPSKISNRVLPSDIMQHEITTPSTAEPLRPEPENFQDDQVSSNVNPSSLVVDDDERSLEPRKEMDTTINVFDYLVVPQRDTTNIDGVNPFVYQDSNDSWTIKVMRLA